MKAKNNKIGLALSGGGYRAAIYHLGTLKKLKELKLLDRIDVISSNSGGSITAAFYSLYHKDFDDFEQKLRKIIKKDIIIRTMLSLRFIVPLCLTIGILTSILWSPLGLPNYSFMIINILVVAGFFFFQFQILPTSKIIEYQYNKLFFNGRKLTDLSCDFKTIINSTNIETGRIFSFSKEKMSDSTYTYSKNILFNHEEFPIARAVMASSCVPFVFTPVKIKKNYFSNKLDYDKINPKLVDGGIYDNQGVHKLTFLNSSSYCKNVIVSDAGNFLPTENWSFNTLFLLIRTSNIFMNRIKNIQMMTNLYSKNTNSIVAYQSLSFDLDQSIDEFIKLLHDGYIREEIVLAHNIEKELIKNGDWESIGKHLKKQIGYENIIKQGCNEDELKTARKVKTSLSSLSNRKINALIKHGESITEMQVKLFLPHLLK